MHKNKKMALMHDGEIWWCSFGKNVGVEINGKGRLFTRPVLILKCLSRDSFLGVPLTSQVKGGSWYKEFKFLHNMEYAALCQARVMSVYRLRSKMGEIPEPMLDSIKRAFFALYK